VTTLKSDFLYSFGCARSSDKSHKHKNQNLHCSETVKITMSDRKKIWDLG